MRLLSVLKDERISATSVLVEMTIDEYLRLAIGAEENLEIQRRTIKGFKPYDRLRDDLKQGCIIPPLVLGLRVSSREVPESIDNTSFLEAVSHAGPSDVFIIDGLQRTNALKAVKGSLSEEPLSTFLKRILRVEIWPNIKLSALTYRMILLNAGQKPMSLKHQLEIVSRPLCDELKIKFPSIEIYREKDQNRRTGPCQYQFAIIAAAFQAFIQKSPHIDVRNEVIAELNQIDVLTDYGNSLEKDSSRPDLTESFEQYVEFLLEFDASLCARYQDKQETGDGTIIPTGINLLTRDTFHLGMAAAYGWCFEHRPNELEASKRRLLSLLNKTELNDPLSIERLEKVQTGFRRKDNTGEQTRSLIFDGFKEYFRSEIDMSFDKVWVQG